MSAEIRANPRSCLGQDLGQKIGEPSVEANSQDGSRPY
jgi:hypothetical protein